MSSLYMVTTGGGWDSVNNVAFSQPASYQPSGFWPAPQYDVIRSETAAPAGGSGTTFRFTPIENPSMAQTSQWNMEQWIGSPYEADLAIPVKVQESQQLEAQVSQKKPFAEQLASGWNWFVGAATQGLGLYDQIRDSFSERDSIDETPRAGYPAGQNVSNTNDDRPRGADVIDSGKQLYNQIKGLFGLGYDQPQPQPVPSVQKELDAGPEFAVSPTMIAVGLILLLMVRK